MSRTNIDINDDVLTEVMHRYGFKTKREAVDYALRALHVEPMSRNEMLSLEGVGWDGDLDVMRGRVAAESLSS